MESPRPSKHFRQAQAQAHSGAAHSSGSVTTAVRSEGRAASIGFPCYEVTDVPASGGVSLDDRSRELCSLLEQGRVLYFPKSPINMSRDDIQFLLEQKQSSRRYHKNIAYRPLQDRVTGFDSKDMDAGRLKEVMKRYTAGSHDLLRRLLPSYKNYLRLEYGSFRPLQEEGRDVRLHARNDLLHVDSFHTRPMYGNRILRVFTNINPTEPRRWITSEPFDVLVKTLGDTAELPLPRPAGTSFPDGVSRFVRSIAKRLGLPATLRSPYDDFMIRMYRHMKENSVFQETCHKYHTAFPPGCSWIVYTDMVSHAALFGQYALEQTFVVDRNGMVCPDKAPVNILERMVGSQLTSPI